ncbi:MAG: hypothetical protein NBV67_18715, partial [Tagaea sp.]|nr:hypothetical protein [Tagaea sp.]
NDPKGLAPEYESYIRDLDKDHGHDPGLIFARDLTQQVEKYHGKGSELAKQFVTLLADRPDLQREYLGGEVPKAPPIGTFKPGGEAGVKAWIDQDRVTNGLKPRYAVPAVARGGENVTEQRVSARGLPATEAINLFDLAQEIQGLPEDGAPAQSPETEDQPVTRDDLRPNARAILEGMENSRREPGVQIAMGPGSLPPIATPSPPKTELDAAADPSIPLPPSAEASAAPAGRPTSQPDPKTLPGPLLENQLQNAQIALEAQTKEVERTAKALADATRAREAKKAEVELSAVVETTKGAISGIAKAEFERRIRPGGDRIVGRARWLNNSTGAARGMGKTVPSQLPNQASLIALREAEANAVAEQNRQLETQRLLLARRDELLHEREARRRIRPDQ